ncbi:MAG: DNA topoisomerase IV, partial [Moorea sp. SIO2B7]|nr:DNA topoisomerase IV [Moorena sp. SIO2B7]
SSTIEESDLLLYFSQTPPEDAVLQMTYQGYIYWETPQTAPKKSRLIKQGEDFLIQTQVIGKSKQLVVITDSGKAYPLNLQDIPPAGKKKKTLLMSLLPKGAQRDAEGSVAHFFLPENTAPLDLVLLTEKGHIKRLPVSELTNLTNRGLVVLKLKEQDRLRYVCLTKEGQEVAISTTGGRVLRFEVNDQQLPIMGRSSQGNQALRLRYGEHLAGCVTLNSDEHLVLVSELGYGKRLPVSVLRLANRGDIGTQALQFTSKMDNLAGMVLAEAGATLILMTNTEKGTAILVDSLEVWGKDGSGDRFCKLKQDEKISSLMSY